MKNQKILQGDESQDLAAGSLLSPRPALASFMCRIPPKGGEAYHVVGETREADPTSEPSRAFWTNASVKALMQQTSQPEYVSICKRVRGDWRSIQVSRVPFDGQLCRRCASIQRTDAGRGELARLN